MMRIAVALIGWMLVLSARADESGAVIYRGERGLAPIPVVYGYLKDRIADEVGMGDYQTLLIKQQSKREDHEHVQVEVVIGGLSDDAVVKQRYQMGLSLVATGWVIDTAKQDWQCRRGGKAWTNKPCK